MANVRERKRLAGHNRRGHSGAGLFFLLRCLDCPLWDVDDPLHRLLLHNRFGFETRFHLYRRGRDWQWFGFASWHEPPDIAFQCHQVGVREKEH
jgi:hypothetical protein